MKNETLAYLKEYAQIKKRMEEDKKRLEELTPVIIDAFKENNIEKYSYAGMVWNLMKESVSKTFSKTLFLQNNTLTDYEKYLVETPKNAYLKATICRGGR